MSSDLEATSPVNPVVPASPSTIKIKGSNIDPAVEAFFKIKFTHIGKELSERIGEKDFEDLRLRKIENGLVASAAEGTIGEYGVKEGVREFRRFNLSDEALIAIKKTFLEISQISHNQTQSEHLLEDPETIRDTFDEELACAHSLDEKKGVVGRCINDFLGIVQREDKPKVADDAIFRQDEEFEAQISLQLDLELTPEDRARLNYTEDEQITNELDKPVKESFILINQEKDSNVLWAFERKKEDENSIDDATLRKLFAIREHEAQEFRSVLEEVSDAVGFSAKERDELSEQFKDIPQDLTSPKQAEAKQLKSREDDLENLQ